MPSCQIGTRAVLAIIPICFSYEDVLNSPELSFYLSKSQYSGIYYMDTWINSKDNENEISYEKRYLYQNRPHLDWQLIDMNDFNIYLKDVLQKEIEETIKNNM